MDVSENSGTPKSPHFNRFFHYKPSILGWNTHIYVAHGRQPSGQTKQSNSSGEIPSNLHRAEDLIGEIPWAIPVYS